jgi:hypothetical protein
VSKEVVARSAFSEHIQKGVWLGDADAAENVNAAPHESVG